MTLSVGDRVLLSTANLSLRMTGARKLMPKFVGPFKVLQRINEVAYKLELPGTMKVHDVFHVSVLKRYEEDPNLTPPPPPTLVDGEEFYNVEHILRHRERRVGRSMRTEYLVRWEGYGPEHDTWEPHKNVASAVEPLNEYLASLGDKSDVVLPAKAPKRNAKPPQAKPPQATPHNRQQTDDSALTQAPLKRPRKLRDKLDF